MWDLLAAVENISSLLEDICDISRTSHPLGPFQDCEGGANRLDTGLQVDVEGLTGRARLTGTVFDAPPLATIAPDAGSIPERRFLRTGS